MSTEAVEWPGLRALHQRLIAGDPTAPDELARQVLDRLLERLQRSFPLVDEDTLWEGTVKAFLDYADEPSQCHAQVDADVFKFLLMVGWRRIRDTLRANKRRAKWEGRYAKEEHPMDPAGESAVEHPDALAILIQNEESNSTSESFRAYQERVMAILTNEVDRRVQELRFAGERRTEAFAMLLGIAGLPRAEQRRRVKQHKDRIDKIIERGLGAGSARLEAPGKRARGRPRE